MKRSKVARLQSQFARVPATSDRSRRLTGLAAKSSPPYTYAALFSIALLLLLVLPLFWVFAIMSRGGLGDCFEPPCGPPADVANYLRLLALLAFPLPFIAGRALFGNHPIGRITLTLFGSMFVAGALLLDGEAARIALVPSVVVLVVGGLAWLKWWVNRGLLERA
jgi:hypothetical protein